VKEGVGKASAGVWSGFIKHEIRGKSKTIPPNGSFSVNLDVDVTRTVPVF
jgi:hypothetical protein